MTLNVVNWNVAWCGSRSIRAPAILRRIRAHKPDVASLTEVIGDLIPGGHAIASDPDYGYGDQGARRKNQLWSTASWSAVDCLGDRKLPAGRFVFGETGSNAGQTWRIMGLCIPWRGMHVSTGYKNRKSWQEHETCLRHLGAVIARMRPDVIMGDFNQRLPFDPKYQVPRRLYENLECVFADYTIVTRNLHPKLIDHIALAPGVTATNVALISNKRRAGRDLSDHLGVAATIVRGDTDRN